MTKRGPYKKRRLQYGLQQLAKSLVLEARHIGRVTFEELDELLDLSVGECERYAASPDAVRKRAPIAGTIQRFENAIAALLKRPARAVVVVDVRTRERIGAPHEGADFLHYSPSDLSLGYSDGWPTFGQIFESERWDEYLFATHMWQWGVLWERNVPELARDTLGIPADVPTDKLIAALEGARKRAGSGFKTPVESYWLNESPEWSDLAWQRLNFLSPRLEEATGRPKSYDPVVHQSIATVAYSVYEECRRALDLEQFRACRKFAGNSLLRGEICRDH